MPCTCVNNRIVFTHYHTYVCTTCGIESTQFVSPSDDTTYNSTGGAPIRQRIYNRPDRWKILVKKVVGTHSGPPRHDPIWDFLHKNKCFSNVPDMIAAIRKCGLKHKHYQCLHTFAKCFVQNYKTPETSPAQVEINLNRYFSHVQHMWNKSFPSNGNFFSYAWLLEQGLFAFNHTEYLLYVKKLICRKRRRKYITMLLKYMKLMRE